MKTALRLLGSLVLLGCSVDPCDPGEKTDSLSFCVAAPATGAGGSEGGAAPQANGGAEDSNGAGEGGGASVCESASDFGDMCTSSAECHCEVDYCAVQPGATSGVCTRTGCVEDPSICPEAWSCFDLKVFDPGLPSICVPPQ